MILNGVLAAVLLFAATLADAQKIARIGILAGGSRTADVLLVDTFWQRMRALGYVEGRNAIGEYRFAEGSLERLPGLAAELVRLNVDVIVAPGSGAMAAKNATNTIPIVITAGDPLALGLVASLAHPGGNVTGLSGFASELGGKQLALLKEAFPKISRVAVLWWRENALVMEDVKAAARPLGVTLQLLELRDASDVDGALAAVKRESTQALIVVRNPLTVTHAAKIADFAAANRLPAMYGDREFIRPGGLMSYGVSIPELWGRAAVYVDKILKGAAPATIPVERPTKFELVINLKAAKAAGLSIAPAVLARADEVVQ